MVDGGYLQEYSNAWTSGTDSILYPSWDATTTTSAATGSTITLGTANTSYGTIVYEADLVDTTCLSDTRPTYGISKISAAYDTYNTWKKCSTDATTWNFTKNTCTYDTTDCIDWTGSNWRTQPRPVPVGDRIRQMMRDRQGPHIIGSRKSMPLSNCVKETRARETLLRVVGNDKFRCFLKHGFISVRAKSGLVYQIFPGHGITKVFNRGKLEERLCVVLSGTFPPTDSIIMRYLLILNDEQEFRKYAIPHSVSIPVTPRSIVEEKSLVEIFRELKAAA